MKYKFNKKLRNMIQENVLVLHVKHGYEDRARNIEAIMNGLGISFEYITDGDMDDITPEIMDRYFSGIMHKIFAPTSCTLKHFYAYEYILKYNLPGALILEDDMVLYNNFIPIFNKCMQERHRRDLENILISFEDSNLSFVPRSQRVKGLHLYKGSRDRFAGCYYISNVCARQIMQYVNDNKCDLPIDCFHNALRVRIGLPYYWCHPTIATQGSHTGLFRSSISEKSAKRQNYRKITWHIKLAYKKALYWLR